MSSQSHVVGKVDLGSRCDRGLVLESEPVPLRASASAVLFGDRLAVAVAHFAMELVVRPQHVLDFVLLEEPHGHGRGLEGAEAKSHAESLCEVVDICVASQEQAPALAQQVSSSE